MAFSSPPSPPSGLAGTAALRELVRKLGPYHGPTASGFLNFCHKACGDKKYRLGLKRERYTCFHCGAKGWIRELGSGEVAEVPRYVRAQHQTRARPARGEIVLPDPETLPWRPIPAEGRLTRLATKVVAYLESRGITRARAALLHLGYGIRSVYTATAVFPWWRDDGTLGGWQSRLTYDPGPQGRKIIHPFPEDWPALYSPHQGGMFGYESLSDGDEVLLVEGPVDTYSGLRVMPTCGVMGSEMYLAQIRRLQRRHPRRVFVGHDADTFRPRWNPASRTWMRPKILETMRRLATAFDDVRVLQYPADFDGDIGGREDKTPHPREVIARLVRRARRWPY